MKVSKSGNLVLVLILTNNVSMCLAQDRQSKSSEDLGATPTVATTDLILDDGTSLRDDLAAEPVDDGGRVSPVGDLKESGPRIDPLDGWAGDWEIDLDTNVEMMSALFKLVLDQGAVGYSFSIFRNGSQVASGSNGAALSCVNTP